MERRGIDTFIHEIIQIKKRQIIRGKCSICKNSIEKKHGLNAYTFLRGESKREMSKIHRHRQ